MGGLEATTWDAVGFAVTAVGLVISVFVWRHRGAGPGLRGVAWSLLPAAAALTGVLRLLADIAGSIAAWGVRFAFNPFAWLGIGLAGVAVLVYGVGSLVRARGRSSAKGRPALGRENASRQVGGRRSRPPAGVPLPAGQDDDTSDDMTDVEAILKRHGIS
jgi:heme exporter protein D